MPRYRVHMNSAPGMWATYEGHVDVVVPLATGAEPGTEGEAGQCRACGLDWHGWPDDQCCPYCHSGEVEILEGTELEQALFRRGVRELARTSFPDRPSLESWRLVAIEDLQ